MGAEFCVGRASARVVLAAVTIGVTGCGSASKDDTAWGTTDVTGTGTGAMGTGTGGTGTGTGTLHTGDTGLFTGTGTGTPLPAMLSGTVRDDGGLPVTEYTVHVFPGGFSVPVTAADVGPDDIEGEPPRVVTLEGLMNGVEHTLSVSATNAAGEVPATDQ